MKVSEVRKNFGKCLELVSMDPNFNNISVGVFMKKNILTVWSYSKKEGINEQEMSIKDAFKDLVKDHGSKKALDILTSVLTGGIGFEDPKKKKIFQQKLLKKMMRESINENGRVIMKSISNAKKGAIATGGGYAPFVKMGKNYWKQKKTNTKTHDDGLFDKIGTFKDFKINEVQVLRKIK